MTISKKIRSIADSLIDEGGAKWDEFMDSMEAGEKMLNPEKQTWSELLQSQTPFFSLEKEAKRIVMRRIGFRPWQREEVNYEHFIRAHLNDFRTGKISQEQFELECESIIKTQRNDIMRRHPYYMSRDWDGQGKTAYETDNPQWRVTAINRLIDIIGYRPDIKISWPAEMCLRHYYDVDEKKAENDKILFRGRISLDEGDYRALNILRYREVLYRSGIEAADNSDLLGILPHFGDEFADIDQILHLNYINLIVPD